MGPTAFSMDALTRAPPCPSLALPPLGNELGAHDDQADPTPPLMKCLRNGWAKKIITVNLQDNVMCVFTSERRVVEEVENLVDAITGPTHA